MPESMETADPPMAPVAKPATPAKEPIRSTQPEEEPPYRVLLHNDKVNVFTDVIRWLHELTPLSLAEAVRRTVEAHTHGKSIVLSTHKERAELYVEQLTSVGLTATMEADN